ncbi:uncharacterized protein PHA67_010051 isoform 1-T1 [Liasis olivaceus]
MPSSSTAEEAERRKGHHSTFQMMVMIQKNLFKLPSKQPQLYLGNSTSVLFQLEKLLKPVEKGPSQGQTRITELERGIETMKSNPHSVQESKLKHPRQRLPNFHFNTSREGKPFSR